MSKGLSHYIAFSIYLNTVSSFNWLREENNVSSAAETWPWLLSSKSFSIKALCSSHSESLKEEEIHKTGHEKVEKTCVSIVLKSLITVNTLLNSRQSHS